MTRAQVPYLILGACLAMLGVGTGMIFPTLTLSYQSAVGAYAPPSNVRLRPTSVAPQFGRGASGTLGHGRQLGPHDLFVANSRADAAVGACCDVFLTDDARVLQYPILDE